MTLLVVLLVALTVLAAAGLSRPWWSRWDAGDTRRRAVNVAAYRQRLVELETEIEAGLTRPDAASQLRREAEVRLVDDAGESSAAAAEAAPAAPRVRRAATLLGLVLAVFAGGYYYSQGSWKTQAILVGARAPDAAAESAAPVEDMVALLAQRLQSRPDDVEGWLMLARSYFMIERYADSAKAYAHLNELTGSRNADYLTGQGEALALSRDRDLAGEPQRLFEQALMLDPAHGKSLWYAGMAADQEGDTATAKAHWTLLRQQEIPPQLQQLIDKRLAEIGGAPAAVAAVPPPAAAPAVATRPAQKLVLDVRLAPALASKLPADAVLIVFAKADQGPPMPLAVHRGPVGQFPVEITLDDSMAMMPSMKLSQFDRWVVTARISHGGMAKAESGDLQGSLNVGRADALTTLPLTIDQVVP